MVLATFLAVAVQFVLDIPVPLAGWLIVGLIDGLIWLPVMNFAVVPFMGPMTRTLVGRLHTLQVFNLHDGFAFILGRGGYEFAPLAEEVPEGGEEAVTVAIMRDGRRVEIDLDDAKEYRLARTRLLVTYEPTEAVLEAYRDDDVDVIQRFGPGDEYRYGILDRVRNGVALFTDQLDPETGRLVDAPVASVSSVISSLRGGGGNEVIDNAENDILKDHGGDRDHGTTAMVAGSVAVIVFTSIMSVLVFGGFV